MSINLCLHSGGKVVTIDEIRALPNPRPMTKDHHPIRHDSLIDLTKDTMGKFGLIPVSETYALAKENQRCFGMMELHTDAGKDYSIIIAIRNADDMSFRASYAAGSNIFCCDNLSFFGEVMIGRKHTLHILRDLPYLIEEAVVKVTGFTKHLEARYDAYKSFPIDDSLADNLIMQMYRREIINVQRIAKVVREWDEPSYDEFKVGKNLWRLFNAATTALKPESGGALMELPGKTATLHQVCDLACHFSNN